MLDLSTDLWIKKYRKISLKKEALKSYLTSLCLFLYLHPALHAGLTIYTAFVLFKSADVLATIAVCSLMIGAFSLSKSRGFFYLFLCLLSFISYYLTLPTFDTNICKKEGEGYFYSEKLVSSPTFFAKGFALFGILSEFHTKEGKIYKRLPCYIMLKNEPEEIYDLYKIHGKITVKDKPLAYIKPHSLSKVGSCYHLANFRMKLQQKVIAYIKKNIGSEKAANLYIALLCGRLEEKLLSLEFTRLGISHLLAISGFHFGLIASSLGSLISLFLPKKYAAILIALLLVAYAFFIGISPSVLRSLSMAILSLFSFLFCYQHNSLNALGISLALCCFILPQSLSSAGFILSFMCTFSLLHLYPYFEKSLRTLFPYRQRILKMKVSFVYKLLFLLSSFLRNSLALNFAILLFTFPMSLYLFGNFPLLSLAYNLFIPFLIGIALPFFIFTSLIHLIFPISLFFLHRINAFLIDTLLTIIHHPPMLFDMQINIGVSKYVALSWALLVFFWSFGKKSRESNALLTCVY